MSNYDELVEALRHCMTKEGEITVCNPCPYFDKGGESVDCEDELHSDAAAAIEALEEDNADLNETVLSLIGMLKSFGEESIQVGKAGNKYTLNEPKRGEWIREENGKGIFKQIIYKCSLCGNYLDFDGVNAGRGDANYCPNCGAKNMEVQDADK